MRYTKKYTQKSKAAARSKFRRMQSGAGFAGNDHFTAWFSTWWIGVDDEDPDNFAIYVSSSYHPKTSLDRMYKSNCKTF